jgi:CubicO group peptidase (beta-lactamase class C family)
MKGQFYPLLVVLLLVRMSSLHGNSMASSDQINYQAIDEYITARIRADHIPGVALAIVKDDQILYLKGYGRADQSGRAVTPQTPFIIGSITKTFTALAVMQLVEAGKVELDAPVQRYIPWFRVADATGSTRITVRMLIDQTSGLPQLPTFVTWTWPNDPDVLERHVRLMANVDLVFPPGEGFAYSNANYVTQGVIVQVVSGQSYEDYIQQHIFAPLDMQHSYVSQQAAMQDGMAMGYRWWFGSPIPATLPFKRSNLPAGFAISSAEDMAHYLIAQLNGGRYQDVSVLGPQGIALMQAEPPPGTYGLGWESVRIDGRRLINFDGATGNFQASVFIDPESRVAVFVAANAMSALDGLSSSRSSSSLGASSARELIRGLLGLDEKKGLLVSALITTRGIAHTVLNITTQRPLPSQGPGQRRVALIVGLVVLLLTGALILSLVRIPEWYGGLAMHGIPSPSDLVWRVGGIAILHFIWPLALLYVALKVPYWIILSLYQPDLVIWLESVAVVVFLKGFVQIALALRVFWQTGQSPIS